MTLRVLSLFAGIGGMDVGLERAGGFRTVAFAEIDPFARRVLAKNWPGVPIYGDVRELTADRLRADGIAVDVIAGGFPCQDVSRVRAGGRAGIEGEKSGLWREFARLIGELRPFYVIVENSAELLARGLGDVLGDLVSLGYDSEWHSLTAAYAGAAHIRDRTWVVSYPAGERDGLPPLQVQSGRDQLVDVPGWQAQSAIRRVADGVPDQSHRLRCLGNAVDTRVPEMIGRAILASLAEQKAAA